MLNLSCKNTQSHHNSFPSFSFSAENKKQLVPFIEPEKKNNTGFPLFWSIPDLFFTAGSFLSEPAAMPSVSCRHGRNPTPRGQQPVDGQSVIFSEKSGRHKALRKEKNVSVVKEKVGKMPFSFIS